MFLSDELVLKLVRLTPKQATKLAQEQQITGQSLQQLVLDHNLVAEQELVKSYGEYMSVPFVIIKKRSIPIKALKLIPEYIAKHYNAIIFKIDDDLLHLALSDPADVRAITFLQKELGAKLKIYIATNQNILDCLESYHDSLVKEPIPMVVSVQDQNAIHEDANDDVADSSPVAQTFNSIIEYAIKMAASDVHIEPHQDYIQIRYRIDGRLHEVNRLPKSALAGLVRWVKTLSNLRISERRIPQESQLKIKLAQDSVACMVSILPIADGEKIVFRMIKDNSKIPTLHQLGVWGRSLKTINRVIDYPHGLVLVTGPNSSGKTTTLFSILSMFNAVDMNISTIEDTIEYKLPGVNQMQANPRVGMSIASGLRALLRQDANLIGVDEVRDGEVAQLDVQATLTGHTILSTFQSANAATGLSRWLDMGIEPFLLASAANVVIGQSLVRRLCSHCRERVMMTETLRQQIFSILHQDQQFRGTGLYSLEKQAKQVGVGDDVKLSATKDTIDFYWKSHEGGCEHCNYTGYKGRVGLYEVLDNTAVIQKLILSAATAQEIQNQAIKEGMVTIGVDGIIKALRGVTSLEEVFAIVSRRSGGW